MNKKVESYHSTTSGLLSLDVLTCPNILIPPSAEKETESDDVEMSLSSETPGGSDLGGEMS